MVYVDTNILIYLLEKHERYSDLAVKALEEFSEHNSGLLTSVITITEFLAGTRTSTPATLHLVPQLQFAMVNESIAEQAALLQRSQRLQIGDAIHLATAIKQKADLFFTNDKQLAKAVAKFIKVRSL